MLFRFTAAFSGLTFCWLLIHQGRTESHLGHIVFGSAAAVLLVIFGFIVWLDLRHKPSVMEIVQNSVGAIFGTYLLAAGTAYFLQAPIIYLPAPGNFMECSKTADRGFTVVSEANGVRYYSKLNSEFRNTLLYFHGSSESACKALHHMDPFDGASLNLVVAELPGYQGAGELSEASYTVNAAAVYDSVRSKVGADSNVFIAGHSFGTGVATWLAGQRPTAGLVLVSPYTSIPDAASRAIPFLPGKLIRSGHEFAIAKWIENVKAPLLVVVGTGDRLIPAGMGQFVAQQYQLATKHPAEILEIPGAGHDKVGEDFTQPTWPRVRAFIEARMAALAPPPPKPKARPVNVPLPNLIPKVKTGP